MWWPGRISTRFRNKKTLGCITLWSQTVLEMGPGSLVARLCATAPALVQKQLILLYLRRHGAKLWEADKNGCSTQRKWNWRTRLRRPANRTLQLSIKPNCGQKFQSSPLVKNPSRTMPITKSGFSITAAYKLRNPVDAIARFKKINPLCQLQKTMQFLSHVAKISEERRSKTSSHRGVVTSTSTFKKAAWMTVLEKWKLPEPPIPFLLLARPPKLVWQ